MCIKLLGYRVTRVEHSLFCLPQGLYTYINLEGMSITCNAAVYIIVYHSSSFSSGLRCYTHTFYSLTLVFLLLLKNFIWADSSMRASSDSFNLAV